MVCHGGKGRRVRSVDWRRRKGRRTVYLDRGRKTWEECAGERTEQRFGIRQERQELLEWKFEFELDINRLRPGE